MKFESEKYIEILTSFCSVDEYRVEWMLKPFRIKDKIHATDGHVVIFTDSINVKEVVQEKETKILDGILPIGRNKNLSIKVSELLDVIVKAPTEEGFSLKEIKSECSECDGSGEVEWEYESHCMDADCPECDGTGETSLEEKIKTGETTIKDNIYIRIGNSRFKASYIEKLIDVCNKVGEKEIVLIHQDQNNRGSLFLMGCFQALLMPVIESEDQIIIAEYGD